jgi:uncharacterized protein DUF732
VRVDGRFLAVTVAAVVAAAVTAGACGGGGSAGADAPNQAAYLTIVHSPMLGTLPANDDATLLALGQRACGDLDKGMRSDAVVADLGGDPLPGSGDFNGYAMITAAAAPELCPAHRAQFQSDAFTGG